MTDPRILRIVAARTLDDARAAWKKARESPSDDTVRTAMRACVLSARALRRAARVTPGESAAMIAAAERADATASTLRDQLIKIVETRRTVL